ncbi:hypothetical protein IQ260_14895 [Leptolyngbya cf. ectocarpi LEGE 11479]|uniref:Uncharacterized protein n=1 Tax=Leptolyngbya cf. ectocarpi LEGE 11479 TaxID=1828722 RepID=A0A928ZUZ7_LEPEC|nr:hypothetical protein [Leptolyngbya ectocarpi]MBE9067939.1 hypothetical protein [Leptolyngbya cf. ectocarpi LEGE 11479]
MAYLSVCSRLPRFIKSASVLLGATLLSSFVSGIALANPVSNSPLADGVYLYGEQSTAAQLGSTYMVFEVTGSRAIGAFYMPSSSFDCFSGDISATRLNLNVIDSYEQTTHPYSLAAQTGPTLTAGQASAEFNINGFTSINEISELDEQILETCQTVSADFI